ncbi:MAG TPA: acetolactate decarboxylase [Solirubrobacteraceae bacterium]|nr:acetolactate decarboxylase [Solirubrobacteraceae bacterium]
MPFDPALIAALHPRVLGPAELLAREPAHAAFQTSTIDALLHGRYEGDVSVAVLLRHGDLGLGTVDHLDGELIVIDGAAWVARADGTVRRVEDSERTPFAVVTPFTAESSVAVSAPLDHGELLALVDRLAGSADGARAVRIDGELDLHARSVPRQEPPYRPLADVVADQEVFELRGLTGTLVGFRFPALAGGLEVPGYHLHAIAADRRRGGHVLRARLRAGTVAVGRLTDLHMELPPGVELPAGPADAGALDRVERQG